MGEEIERLRRMAERHVRLNRANQSATESVYLARALLALLPVYEAAPKLLAALDGYIKQWGADHEVDECPEDDTCECPLVVALNDMWRVSKEALAAADKAIGGSGE